MLRETTLSLALKITFIKFEHLNLRGVSVIVNNIIITPYNCRKSILCLLSREIKHYGTNKGIGCVRIRLVNLNISNKERNNL